MIDADAERLGDAVGGNVVMGRSDTAGGKDVGVTLSQRIEGRDDVGLVVATTRSSLRSIPILVSIRR